MNDKEYLKASGWEEPAFEDSGWTCERFLTERGTVRGFTRAEAVEAQLAEDLRLVSLVCTVGAYLCVDRIVALTGGNRTRAGWLFAASFPVAAYGASGYVPRPLLAGLAGVVGLLVYGTLAARVDGRFAWLACAFTVPMALIPRRK